MAGVGGLRRPGRVGLPSGRLVQVGEREETWVTVELQDGVRLVVDLDEPDGAVWVTLHRARTAHDGPPATRPYHCSATVRFEGTPPAPVIRDIPSTLHQRTCHVCPPDERSSLQASVPVGLLAAYVDVLAGLSVDPEPWFVPAEGARLWRGVLDAERRAVVEVLGPDERTWDTPEASGFVDLGLS